MAQPVTIPLSFVELVVQLEHPSVTAFSDRAAIVQAIFEALLPWSAKLDDVEILTTGKLSEQGLVFRLPLKQTSLFFGPVFCRFGRDNGDWGDAEETITIFETALAAFVKLTGLRLAAKTVAVGLHIQPKSGSFMSIIEPFVPPQISSIEEETPRTMASVVRWSKRMITLDGSGSIANAVFLKFEREFLPATTFTEIAEQVLADQQQIYGILGVEEIRG